MPPTLTCAVSNPGIDSAKAVLLVPLHSSISWLREAKEVVQGYSAVNDQADMKTQV